MTLAVITTIVILGVLALFQVLLACGAPFGYLAWGGTHRTLPPKLRIGSILSVIIYAGIALCLLSKAAVLTAIPPGVLLNTLSWVIFTYFLVGVFINILSRSKPERYVMSTVSLILASCTFVIAIS
ncbi:hypothetical protein KI440_00345 [Candidatus Saccharibacteria bacterium TM7i]|nr:hypothetical protein KI440_00345 [Candidatus Saccharibacteria bacterium TM7i]